MTYPEVILIGRTRRPRPVPRAVGVLYCDADSTVRHGFDELGRFVSGPSDVRVFPEALARIREWKERGGRVAIVSNQGGIALGFVTRDAVLAAMEETQIQLDNLLDFALMCPHHPDAKDPVMAYCWCRKPSAGAIIEAAYGLGNRFPAEYYPPHLALFVGDRPEDEQCAQAANVRFMWAKDWREGAPYD